jgi:hypothetical protein
MKEAIVLLSVFLPLALAVVIALRLMGATRLWPAALLIVTAPLEVYRSSSGAGLNVSVFRIALTVAMLSLAIDLVRGRMRFPRRVAFAFVIYLAFLGWQLASLLFVTANHTLAYRFLGQWASGLLAAFVITCYVRRRDLYVVAAMCGAAVVVPLIAAAYRVFSVRSGGSGDLPGLTELPLNLSIEAARQSGSTLLNGTQRLSGTFADPNQFGFYIGTAFVVMAGASCAAILEGRAVARKSLASYLLLSASTALAILGTYSRSTWLLAAVGAVVLVVLLGREFWTRRRRLVIGGMAVALIAPATPLIVSRLNSSEGGNAKSTEVHVHTMRLAWHLLVRHPVTGVGLGGYGRYAGQPPLISSSVSTFLTVGAELGVLGLGLLIGAIATTGIAGAWSVVRAADSDRPLLAGFVAAFIALAIANSVGEVWMNDFQWVLFGSLVALTSQPMLSVRRQSSPRVTEQSRRTAPQASTVSSQVQ